LNNANADNVSLVEDSIPIPDKKSSGRKKVKRDRAAVYRQLRETESKLARVVTRFERHKKRLQRVTAKVSGTTMSPSPGTKVKKLLGGRKVPAVIRKQLLFGEVLEAQLKEQSRVLETDKCRQVFAKMVGTRILKKYRMMTRSESFLSKRRSEKVKPSEKISLEYERKKKTNAIQQYVADSVEKFLEQDCNSQMCPGKRDTITRKNVKKQKSLLQDIL